MNDAKFKKLSHCIGPNHIATRGTSVSVAPRYKPDITVRGADDSLAVILECEQKTDRKAFLGDLVKAEKYAEEEKATPILIIVMQQSKSTTVLQIAKHLRPYAAWLARLKNGRLNLAKILIISDKQYMRSLNNAETIGSTAFRKRAKQVACAALRSR